MVNMYPQMYPDRQRDRLPLRQIPPSQLPFRAPDVDPYQQQAEVYPYVPPERYTPPPVPRPAPPVQPPAPTPSPPAPFVAGTYQWSDASRGLAQPGRLYAQVLTPVNMGDVTEVSRWNQQNPTNQIPVATVGSGLGAGGEPTGFNRANPPILPEPVGTGLIPGEPGPGEKHHPAVVWNNQNLWRARRELERRFPQGTWTNATDEQIRNFMESSYAEPYRDALTPPPVPASPIAGDFSPEGKITPGSFAQALFQGYRHGPWGWEADRNANFPEMTPSEYVTKIAWPRVQGLGFNREQYMNEVFHATNDAGRPKYAGLPDTDTIYRYSIPNPNKIVAREWMRLPTSTQQFMLGAYEDAGWDPSDVLDAILKTLPRAAAFRGGFGLVRR